MIFRYNHQKIWNWKKEDAFVYSLLFGFSFQALPLKNKQKQTKLLYFISVHQEREYDQIFNQV